MPKHLAIVRDVNVKRITPRVTPHALLNSYPLSERMHGLVVNTRRAIARVLRGEDDRFIVIVGPCSIHDPEAARAYASKLAKEARAYHDRMVIIMRFYTEKPRTRGGWKGIVSDPHMDGSCDVNHGLTITRQLASEILQMGLPIGTEALDPFNFRYISDLVVWASVGARTVESQPHREMASGLSMPVGFKNATNGSVEVAVDAVMAARLEHVFTGINDAARTSNVLSTGNRYGHLVLRGGAKAPNYDAESIRAALELLRANDLHPSLIVDCSHGNSQKKPEQQKDVLRSIIEQRVAGNKAIVGCMIESNLVGGSQRVPKDLSELQFGISITDACIGWEETAGLLAETYDALSR